MRELLPNETITIRCVADGTEGANCGKCLFRAESTDFCKFQACCPSFRSDGQYTHFEDVKDMDSKVHKIIQMEVSAGMRQRMDNVMRILRQTGYFTNLSEEEGVSEAALEEQFRQAVMEGEK